MRIAMVGRYYNRQGGVSAVMAELCDRAGREHQVDVYTHEALDTAGSPATFVEVPMSRRPAWLQVPSFAWHLRKVLDPSRYDVVHIHDGQGLGADVITAHSCTAAWFDVARQEVGPPRSWLSHVYPPHVSASLWERYALKRPDAPIIAVSAKTASELERYLGIDASRLTVIYNGIDTKRFAPAASREEARQSVAPLVRPQREDAVVLLFIGYSFHRKGLGRAIEAVANADDPTVELWVAGGDDPEPYIRLARERGIEQKVRFLGHQSNVVGLLQAADAFIFPTSYDPFPLVLLEAIGCGTPVITSRAAGIAEVMTDGVEGFLLNDPLSVAELSGALQRFLAEPERWATLGQNARELALQWTWDAIWERTEQVYREVARHNCAA